MVLSVKELAKKVLTEKENKRYERLLADRKVSYGEWIAAREDRELWAGGSAEPQAADRDFVLIRAGGGVLAENAVKYIARFFMKNPESMIVYGDEDVWEQVGGAEARRCPWFKPDWSPDLLDSFFYFGSLVAVRRRLFEELWGSEAASDGGYGAVMEETEAAEGISCYRVLNFAAYEQWMLECVRRAGAYGKGNRGRVGHVDRILFHGASEEQQKLFWQASEALKRRRRERIREYAESCTKSGDEETVVSVIVPSKDNSELLEKCLRAVKGAAGILPVEVIVVDNGSEPEEKRRIEKIIQDLKNEGQKLSYLYCPMEFNFSRMCNMGAGAARGALLLFLNDDVELVKADSLLEMAALANRDYTGAVGMKLYYPAVERIQHIGITNLPMGPVHKLQSLKDNERYYDGFNCGLRNFLAVTAACLMVSREKFREAGGFFEELRVAFNDVDFCFRLYELGYHNVCVNTGFAYHFESFSRGDDESEEKLERLLAERKRLYERHPLLEGADPYYSAGLSAEGLDVRVRPAYMTAGNSFQKLVKMQKADLKGCRQDACLMVSAEDFRERRLTGWSVVLGDNNACYEKRLLLKRIFDSEKRDELPEAAGLTEEIYEAMAEGSYRPDLEENMPDQKNVALSGFQIQFGEALLPAGDYLIGICARNRVTGLRLVKWSNRRIEL